MTQTLTPLHCADFLDQLDAWLAREVDAATASAMQAHAQGCAACREEVRLAVAIDSTLHALPAHDLPGLHHSEGAQQTSWWREHWTQLKALWSQPLVYAPALALAAALGIVLLRTEPEADPGFITVDGVEYSQAEVLRAAADLELALRYLDKYGSFPARLVNADRQDEMQSSRDASGQPTI
jgi:anti-sigma factor RsiW